MMNINRTEAKEIKKIYTSIKPAIEARMEDFSRLGRYDSDEDIFAELTFCLFTPQSKAKSCWAAVQNLLRKKLLFKGSAEEIAENIKNIRFRNNKAKYVVYARNLFRPAGQLDIREEIKKFWHIREARDWLVKTVKGFGYKEASHFLRNIGYGENLAILDRHILKNLKLLGAILEIPKNISVKKYFEIERRFAVLAEILKIPAAHLDLVLWYREVGEIFK